MIRHFITHDINTYLSLKGKHRSFTASKLSENQYAADYNWNFYNSNNKNKERQQCIYHCFLYVQMCQVNFTSSVTGVSY